MGRSIIEVNHSYYVCCSDSVLSFFLRLLCAYWDRRSNYKVPSEQPQCAGAAITKLLIICRIQCFCLPLQAK